MSAAERRPLLLYLARDSDPQRTAVGPALAAVCERAGWDFECYYDALRRGRHFGGGPPEAYRAGEANGGLVAGGGHVEQVLWLATHHAIAAVGDPDALLWPVVDAAGAEALARSADPATIYTAVFERLGEPLPDTAVVVDAAPQPPAGVVVAPFAFPAILAGPPRVAVEASCSATGRERLEGIGILTFEGIGVHAEFPGGLASNESVDASSYAALTAGLAQRHADWGRGVLIGDPALVAAQLPKARRLRLIPLHGRPQSDVIERAEQLIRRAAEPVWGRQYDDTDFFTLAALGHGLQVLDPAPPFDAARNQPPMFPEPPGALAATEPGDAELEHWADEGRVLVTLLLWSGMVREVDCIPRLIDLVLETGLRAGLLLTAETLDHAARPPLTLLSVPAERGGAFGLLEPLLSSTGRGVAAEADMPPGTLEASLSEAVQAAAARLPPGLRPRGWWPLLDTPLVRGRTRRVEFRGGRPSVVVDPRAPDAALEAEGDGDGGTRVRPAGARALTAAAAHKLGLRSLFDYRRPFDDRRPGAFDESIAGAVRAAGLEYMFTKAGFGTPRVVHRDGDFVALPSTAGRWDGWSPFYTLSHERDLRRAERRLGRGPGWLVSTIDGPLWALSGEVWENGGTAYRIAELAARGGSSGRLVNVTPNVVARYARLLDRRVAERD